MSTEPARFRDREIVLANSVVGRPIVFGTANPANYHEAISRSQTMARCEIDGQLFLPKGAARKVPAVIVVPGSLGVGPAHMAHAERYNALGVATFVIDPFGSRGVTSTVSNQAQYSFAASAHDVLAAVKVLAERPEIDATRIGAQGHSRGGSAVLTAAMERLAATVLDPTLRLRAVYAAYPWCGHQFLDPDTGRTRVRAIIGDRDDWCLPQQVQGYMQAIRLRGGDVSFRLVADAAHSFDREMPLTKIEEASVAPGAPTAYIADDGAFLHPVRGVADASITDIDLMYYAIAAGYGVRGANFGSKPGQPELFREDATAFWKAALDV